MRPDMSYIRCCTQFLLKFFCETVVPFKCINDPSILTFVVSNDNPYCSSFISNQISFSHADAGLRGFRAILCQTVLHEKHQLYGGGIREEVNMWMSHPLEMHYQVVFTDALYTPTTE
jgi:hypothetical protein